MSRAQSPMPTNMLPPIKLPETTDSTPPSSSSVASSPAYDMAPRSRFYDTGSSMASKRSHEETFGPDNRPLFNGNRPDSETYPEAPRKPFESPYLSLAEMGEYRRANGSTRTRVMKAGVLQ